MARIIPRAIFASFLDDLSPIGLMQMEGRFWRWSFVIWLAKVGNLFSVEHGLPSAARALASAWLHCSPFRKAISSSPSLRFIASTFEAAVNRFFALPIILASSSLCFAAAFFDVSDFA